MNTTTDAVAQWAPLVELNLETTGTTAFADTVAKFYEATKGLPISPLQQQNGWCVVNPELAEDLLRRNTTNRKVSLQTVKKYYFAMKNGEWRRTGQALIVSQDGKAQDLQHRCWAAYLGRVSFPSYLITDAPIDPELFAYIDDNKPRSAADALQTSGMNGLSSTVAGAIKLAWRYENKALGILQQPRIRDMSVREVLTYSQNHPALRDAVHMLLSNWGRAVSVIGNKPVAAFFAWKVIERFGADALDEFVEPLGSGANLDADSPILALRNRLLQSDEETEGDLRQPRRLALLIKAFAMHRAGKKISTRGLYVRDNEKFPRFEDIADADLQQAA